MAEPITSVSANSFTLLSLIAAPAVMTNAASLLVLSTSNRFARAVDRARSLAGMLGSSGAAEDPQTPLRMRQLERAERRSLLLLKALRSFYLSLGSFAAASLISLIGAGVARSTLDLFYKLSLGASLTAGVAGVGALVVGCLVLVRETRLAVYSITEEAGLVRERLGKAMPPPGHRT